MGDAAAPRSAIVDTAGLGDRVRALRRAAGLSQAELADGRFSKEYVSQLERGKTRPSAETLAWLAERLDTDVAYLETGVSSLDRERAEAALETATELLQVRRHGEAVAAFRAARSLSEAAGAQQLVLRALIGEAEARIGSGDVGPAVALVRKAASLSERERVAAVDLASLAYVEGLCHYTLNEIEPAIAHFDRAIAIAEGSGAPCDRLRADVLDHRSRCYRRLRDIEAAREDAERVLELAASVGDPRRRADALFQAMLVAQREGRWLIARTHGREALALYEEVGDARAAARLLNNLAGVEHLLGNATQARALLHDAFDRFVSMEQMDDAAYVLGSLAEIYVAAGDPARAEPLARRAIEILGDRVEHAAEVGMAHVTAGRALLQLGDAEAASRHIVLAEEALDRTGSPSHRAEAWLAGGDLALSAGDAAEAAKLFRQAAVALQDTRS